MKCSTQNKHFYRAFVSNKILYLDKFCKIFIHKLNPTKCYPQLQKTLVEMTKKSKRIYRNL